MFGMRVGAVGARRRPGSGLLPSQTAPVLDYNFVTRTQGPMWTYACSTTATDLVYDGTPPANSVAVNTPVLGARGVFIQPTRTQSFASPAAPATQSISLANGTYILWIAGSGSGTSSAGTAVGSGFGAATAGTPNVFTITSPGTVTITIAGGPSNAQVENATSGTAPSSFIGGLASRGNSVDNFLLGSWFNPAAFSFVAEFDYPGILSNGEAGVTSVFFRMDDGTNNNRVSINWPTGTQNVVTNVGSGGVTLTTGDTVAMVAGATVKWGVSLTAGQLFTCRNGGTVTDVNGGTVIMPVGINKIAWATVVSGFRIVPTWRRRIRFWNRALSSAELQAATA